MWVRSLSRLGVLVCLLAWATPAAALERAQGFCEDGNQTVATGSLTSATRVQRSYPGCTVTVFVSGTATLATIYADNVGTPKANPFTALGSGVWFFYGKSGYYDVTLSGGGIPTPFTRSAIHLNDSAGSYLDLREYGAICDGVTNVEPAVLTAMAAGVTHLFLPANCFYQPTTFVAAPAGFTGWLVPAGLDIKGEDLLTSKIWAPNPANAANYLLLGPRVYIEHVNTNGQGCYNATGTPHVPVAQGCPVFRLQNQNAGINIQVLAVPYSDYFDVGSDPYSATFGQTAIVVFQRGDGGGIFTNYVGGLDNSGGAGIQMNQAWPGPGGAAAIVSRTNDGPGLRLLDLAGSEGLAHTPTPAVDYATGIRRHGTTYNINQYGVNYDGTVQYFSMANGAGGQTPGSFTGRFAEWYNAGVLKFGVDYNGNLSVGGIVGVQTGTDVVSAATITPTGELFRVSGSAAIGVINVPQVGSGLLIGSWCLKLIPAPGSTWTTIAGGNIALGSTAVVGKMLIECFSPSTGLYYPSY